MAKRKKKPRSSSAGRPPGPPVGATGRTGAVGDALATDRASESPGRDRLVAWISSHKLEIMLIAGLWLVASIVMSILSGAHVTPRRYQDEFLYWETAQSLARGDWISWRGETIGIRSPLYIFLIAPIFLVTKSIQTGYNLVHIVNAFTMSAVVFPTYVLARRFVSYPWALVAATFAVAIPSMNYVGVIGTEVLAYPVAAAAFAAMIFAIQAPTRRSWLVATGFIVLAFLTRTQFALFGPIFPVSMLAMAAMAGPGARVATLRRYREPLIVYASVVVVVVGAYLLAPESMLGLYQGILTEFKTPDVSEVLYWLRGFLADTFLLAGIAPTIAFIALALGAIHRRDPQVGPLIAVGLVATAFFVAQDTWFSAINPYGWKATHVFYERYIFYLAPLYFVGFVLFFKRAQLTDAVLATLIGASLLTLFHSDNILVPFSYDAWSLTWIGEIMQSHPGFHKWVGWTAAGIAAGLGGLLAFTVSGSRWSRPASIGVASVVLAFMAVAQSLSWSQAKTNSIAFKAGLPAPVDFIDRSTDEDVGLIITSDDAPVVYFSVEFWNDRVVRAFLMPNGPKMYSPRCEIVFRDDGEFGADTCDRVPNTYYIRNRSAAMHFRDVKREVRADNSIRLTTVATPPRVSSLLSGRDVFSGEIAATQQVGAQIFDAVGSVITFKIAPPDGAITLTASNGKRYRVSQGQTRTIRILLSRKVETVTLVAKPDDPNVRTVIENVTLTRPGASPEPIT